MVKLKSFFKKVGLWFKNHAPTKRRLIQLYSMLLFNANLKGFISGTIYQGSLKNLCTPGLNCYSCPGASFACPLGALQDSMAQSDKRAPFYIIGILALYGLMLARTICGFLCPFGFCQDLLYKIKTPKLKKSRYTRILSYFKYVLLAVFVLAIPAIYHGIPAFCKYVCPAGTFGGSVGLLSNPNNSGFYTMLGYLFSWKFALLVVFIVACIFIYRFFCRFFCPLGAIYGFFNKYALIGVKLEEKKCVDCGMCIQTCKMDIKRVGDHECINCGECIPVCPTKAITWKGSKIFLKGISVTEDSGEAETEVKPLAQFVKTENSESAVSEAVEENTDNSAEQTTEPEQVETVSEASTEESANVSAPKAMTVEQRIKRRSFWLQFGAWAAALLVLLTAILYFNVIDKQTKVVTYGVGERCPDFVMDAYASAGNYDEDGNLNSEFSLIENRGKVIIINFWYTTCDPCVAELPYFEKVRAEFGDEIIMIAVHSATAMPANGAAGVQEFIDNEEYVKGNKIKDSWTDYGIIFVQDTSEINLYNTLGGTGAYPTTVIVDTDGYISYFQDGPVEEDELRGIIKDLTT